MRTLQYAGLPQVKLAVIGVIIAASLVAVQVAASQTSEPFTPPGPNLALGKSYTLDPKPNYRYCTDPGDNEQLTDGEYTQPPGNFWQQRGCVGWSNRPLVLITIDLGEIAPIAGLSFSTAGGAAYVTWPQAVLMLTSDDGEAFHFGGDLLALSSGYGIPEPSGYQRHRFVTDQLRTHGRFVCLAVVAGGIYTFCDEIEVYRGSEELLAAPLAGPGIDDLKEFFAGYPTALGIHSRIARDISQAQAEISSSLVESASEAAKQLDDQLCTLAEANKHIVEEPGADYRAIYPLNDNHARLGEVVAPLRREQGFPSLFLWHNDRWEQLGPWDVPAQAPPRPPTLSVRLMANEARAETLNIANFTDEPQAATVSFSGLPGGAAPEYITVRPAVYVAMQAGFWDAAALPDIPRDDNGWRITLPPGVSQQLWLSFHPGDMPAPGRYRGYVIVDIEGQYQQLRSPLRLVVEPLRFPDKPTLTLTMWDYAHGRGLYDLSPGNLPAAIAHMRSHNYDAPWASSTLFPKPKASDFDTAGNLTRLPDFSAFDAWVASFPEAKYYMVFANVRESYAGADMGTPEFNQRVGATMRAWADHAREIDIDPRQIAILLVDEPSRTGAERRILAWAKPIKAAAPELRIFEDPHRADPQNSEVPEMFEICDILCPGRGIFHVGDEVLQFYEDLRQGGRELWFYSSFCPGSAPTETYARHQWRLWQAGATGTGYWSYGDAGGTGNSWNPLGTRRMIYSPLFIDSDSVTDSKYWLAMIEGRQDYEYLCMLRDRVDELTAAGDSGEALADARELLSTVPGEVVGQRLSCDQGRLRVLDALMALAR